LRTKRNNSQTTIDTRHTVVVRIRPWKDSFISVTLIRCEDTEKDDEGQVGQYKLYQEAHASCPQAVDEASWQCLDEGQPSRHTVILLLLPRGERI
jgi:hypothetical protein